MRRPFVVAVGCVLFFGFVMSAVVGGAAPPARAASAEWTLAVYLDADNNLDLWAQKDVVELMAVGSTSAVNVVILWDTYSGPAHAYKVLKGGLKELKDFSLNGMEVGMGEAPTLRAFATYAFSAFPAKQRALLLWDHGDDIAGMMYDDHTPGVGFDLLTHQEAVTALAGIEIDAMVFGACVLQIIEVSYEYFAGGLDIGYLVADEGYDPMDGMPYDTILAKLVAQPTMSALELSRLFADEYIDYYEYEGKAYAGSVTISVVELDRVGKVVEDLRGLTTALREDIAGYEGIISDARGHANLPWSENGWERLVDLPTFVRTVHEESLQPEFVQGIDPVAVASVIPATEAVLASLDDAILYVRNTHAMESAGCLGMGIYFPTSRESFEHVPWITGYVYDALSFAHEGWFDFLDAYWTVHTD